MNGRVLSLSFSHSVCLRCRFFICGFPVILFIRMASATPYACVICQERFKRNEISALQCGHTFHLVCIMQWMKVNKSCPKCRQKTTERSVVEQLFFDNYADDSSAVTSDSVDFLKFEVSTLKSDLSDVKKRLESANEGLSQKEVDALILKHELETLSQKVTQKQDVINTMKRQFSYLQPYQKKFEAAEKEIETLKTQLVTYRKIDAMNNGSPEEADLVLEGILNSSSSSNCAETMRIFLISLKKSYNDVCLKKVKLVDSNDKLTKELEKVKRENEELKTKLHHAREELKIRNVGAQSTPCNPHVRSLLKDTPLLDGDTSAVGEVLTPVLQPFAKFRFKDVTNDAEIRRNPFASFDHCMAKAANTLQNVLAPSSSSGLNVPTGKAAEPHLHFRSKKTKKSSAPNYLAAIDEFKKSDGFGSHARMVTSTPRASNWLSGPAAAVGKRMAPTRPGKDLKRLKSATDMSPQGPMLSPVLSKAPVRPASAVPRHFSAAPNSSIINISSDSD